LRAQQQAIRLFLLRAATIWQRSDFANCYQSPIAEPHRLLTGF
jgi:hypothetical protein